MCFACFEIVVTNEHELLRCSMDSIYLAYFHHNNRHTKTTIFWPTSVFLYHFGLVKAYKQNSYKSWNMMWLMVMMMITMMSSMMLMINISILSRLYIIILFLILHSYFSCNLRISLNYILFLHYFFENMIWHFFLLINLSNKTQLLLNTKS